MGIGGAVGKAPSSTYEELFPSEMKRRRQACASAAKKRLLARLLLPLGRFAMTGVGSAESSVAWNTSPNEPTPQRRPSFKVASGKSTVGS